MLGFGFSDPSRGETKDLVLLGGLKEDYPEEQFDVWHSKFHPQENYFGIFSGLQ